MVSAAAGHDDGWTYNDEIPALNPSGRPADLFADGTGASLQLQIHKNTAETGRKRSLYAALLISMHRTGLTQNRYGVGRGVRLDSVKKAGTRMNPEVREWVVEEERWQKEVLADGFLPFGDPVHLWSNYRLLQVWDRMSLYLCHLVSNGTKVDTIFPVPTKYGKRDLKMKVERARSGDVVVKPWPFQDESITVSVRTRAIGDLRYASPFDAAKTLLAATPRIVAFHLTGALSKAQ